VFFKLTTKNIFYAQSLLRTTKNDQNNLKVFSECTFNRFCYYLVVETSKTFFVKYFSSTIQNINPFTTVN